MTVSYILLQDAAPAGAMGGGLGAFLPLILIIVVFYFFMIRPQMKKQKELKNYRSALQKGDKVVTTGGIYGKITSVSDNTVDVEIANGITIKVDKYAILKDSSDLASQK
jgi:preprotein translocase subunit YajC